MHIYELLCVSAINCHPHGDINTNNCKSAHAIHTLNNKHEYGPIQYTMKLIKTCHKVGCINCFENSYIQLHQYQVLTDKVLAKRILSLLVLTIHKPNTLAHSNHTVYRSTCSMMLGQYTTLAYIRHISTQHRLFI
jgi:hypothetical protein